MKDSESAAPWEDRPEDEDRQIANMDEYDFMALLVESRIIQAS